MVMFPNGLICAERKMKMDSENQVTKFRHIAVPFSEVPLKCAFRCNETLYIKWGTRTAKLVSNGNLYYFRNNEACHVAYTEDQ